MEVFTVLIICTIIGIIAYGVIFGMYYTNTPPFNSIYQNPMTGEWLSEPPVFTRDEGNVCGPYCNEMALDPIIEDIVEGL